MGKNPDVGEALAVDPADSRPRMWIQRRHNDQVNAVAPGSRIRGSCAGGTSNADGVVPRPVVSDEDRDRGQLLLYVGETVAMLSPRSRPGRRSGSGSLS
jgi:hypothetical protein